VIGAVLGEAAGYGQQPAVGGVAGGDTVVGAQLIADVFREVMGGQVEHAQDARPAGRGSQLSASPVQPVVQLLFGAGDLDASSPLVVMIEYVPSGSGSSTALDMANVSLASRTATSCCASTRSSLVSMSSSVMMSMFLVG
jgi:hypothetical protein